ncbi:MAG: hypothetical protein Ct9H300mP1_04130 [Planctomycetaceae bacterium]|nr:MAG: hypothetical protein Ct9H300mP1_04130 [Planctomycetaceae bacterium]
MPGRRKPARLAGRFPLVVRFVLPRPSGETGCLSPVTMVTCIAWRPQTGFCRSDGGGPDGSAVMGNGQSSPWPARGGFVIADGSFTGRRGSGSPRASLSVPKKSRFRQAFGLNDNPVASKSPNRTGSHCQEGVTARAPWGFVGNRLLVPTGRAVPAVFDRPPASFSFTVCNRTPSRSHATRGHGRVFINGGLAYDLAPGPAQGPGAEGRFGRQDLWRGPAGHWRTGNDQTGGKDEGEARHFRELKRHSSLADVPGAGKVGAGTPVVRPAKTGSPWRCGAGKVTWTHQVGAPHDWRLGRSSVRVHDSGRLYCFGDRARAEAGALLASKPDAGRDDPVIAAAATRILETSGISSGYCVDLGCGEVDWPAVGPEK